MSSFRSGLDKPGDVLARAIEAAERWAIFDPNPKTRSAVDRLVDGADESLIGLFEGRLSFGTAGLRAQVGPGPNRMNALVVRQTTAAVVSWLIEQGLDEPLLVIGYDARSDSEAFARHASAAARALGARVELADQALATPIVAHRLVQAQADAAVVITASHNPPQDNGYKLYLGDGLQLVAPADAQIAARIDEMAAHWSQWATTIDDHHFEAAVEATGDATADVAQISSGAAWEADHRNAALGALLTDHRNVNVVYTPLHGVGGMSIVGAFRAAGFADPVIVEEQFEPDAGFPTVAFPNPEEPGALDLALALAVDEEVDAVLANDPDADRLSIAVRDRSSSRFVALSGNQVGAMLADHVLRHTSGERVVARSVVSSRLLDRLAAATSNVTAVVTLTGFKWVARPIVTHAPSAYVFGFEEALGYCISDHVRDKDGITAALVAAEILAELKVHGRTVWDRLDELAEQHGVHITAPVTIRYDDDPARAAEITQALHDQVPTLIAGVAVARSGDVGFGSLPPSAGVHLELADDTQIIVRPSGTEPKLKAYIEVIEPVSTSVEAARAIAAERLDLYLDAVRALLD